MKKVFSETGDFVAFSAATKWLDDNGYSYGSMQREAPIGVMKGKFLISKWRGLSRAEIKELDGVIEGDSKRDGPITVTIYESKSDPRPVFYE